MLVYAVPLKSYVTLTPEVKQIMGITHHKVLHDIDGLECIIWLSDDEIVHNNVQHN